MVLHKVTRKKRIVAMFLIVVFSLVICKHDAVKGETVITKEEATKIVKEIFDNRNKAIIDGDLALIKNIFDTKTRNGLWAYEYEAQKVKYLHNWEEKQGVKFTRIAPTVIVRRVRGNEEKLSLSLICSTEYQYVYENDVEEVNCSRIGTEHVMNLTRVDNRWVITKEWYKDPFGDFLDLQKLKVDSIKEFILTQDDKDLSTMSERRKKAVEYARRYCGAAGDESTGYKYNKKYRDYNPEGGDCANFASQILHEGGGFRKNGAWGYDSSGATRAWLNADGFKNYMVGSGRASVIAYGNYEKVYKASYKLLPGDFVAYEKKGDITHISTVTDLDSKGYALVTCHNTDRKDVPWDLGWSDKKVKFWLVRVHY